MFKEILKASRNNQASIFAFTFKFKIINSSQDKPKKAVGRIDGIKYQPQLFSYMR